MYGKVKQYFMVTSFSYELMRVMRNVYCVIYTYCIVSVRMCFTAFISGDNIVILTTLSTRTLLCKVSRYKHVLYSSDVARLTIQLYWLSVTYWLCFPFRCRCIMLWLKSIYKSVWWHFTFAQSYFHRKGTRQDEIYRAAKHIINF